MKNKAGFILLLLLLATASANAHVKTFYRYYGEPDEVVTKVGDVHPYYTEYNQSGYPTGSLNYLVLLEGYDRYTRVPFCRLQNLDASGEPQDDYADAYVGESGNGSYLPYGYNNVIAPEIISQPHSGFVLRWRKGYPDHNETVTGQALPDSIQEIEEFPTALSYIVVFNKSAVKYLMAGRAMVNGSSRAFIVDADSLGQLNNAVLFPDSMLVITEVGIALGSYIAVGRTMDGNGRIFRLDYAGNLLWSQAFPLSAQCKPVMACHRSEYIGSLEHPITLSYQDNNRVMHIAMYNGTDLEEVFAEQLDTAVESIPVQIKVGFGGYGGLYFFYKKDGKAMVRYLSDGSSGVSEPWELPGPDNGEITYSGFYSSDYYHHYSLVAGYLQDGGYFVRNVGNDGFLNYDSTVQPDASHLKVFPNPFIRETYISFELKNPGKVKLEIFNSRGQKVKDLLNKTYLAGKFSELWSVWDMKKTLPSGVYFVKMHYNGKIITKKMLLYKDNSQEFYGPPYKGHK